MDVRNRIIYALDKSSKTRQALAEKLGVGRGAVSDMLNKEGEFDSLKYLEATAELTGFNFEWLRTGEGREMPEGSSTIVDKTYSTSGVSFAQVNEGIGEYLSGKNIRPVAVVVTPTGKELITYVPVKAQAGYRTGYADPQYLEKLPAFSLPINITGSGTYRMFQVKGDSMTQLGGGGLHDGDIVIASYVEDIFELKDNRVYVFVTPEEVLVKRVLNRLKIEAERVLVLKSDNKSGQFKNIILHPPEILEVWELKLFISRQLNFNTDLWEVLGDLQAEQTIIREKIAMLEKESSGRQNIVK
jgi:phage repressor protein C with HTH and peptisase S24 domain